MTYIQIGNLELAGVYLGGVLLLAFAAMLYAGLRDAEIDDDYGFWCVLLLGWPATLVIFAAFGLGRLGYAAGVRVRLAFGARRGHRPRP